MCVGRGAPRTQFPEFIDAPDCCGPPAAYCELLRTPPVAGRAGNSVDQLFASSVGARFASHGKRRSNPAKQAHQAVSARTFLLFFHLRTCSAGPSAAAQHASWRTGGRLGRRGGPGGPARAMKRTSAPMPVRSAHPASLVRFTQGPICEPDNLVRDTGMLRPAVLQGLRAPGRG